MTREEAINELKILREEYWDDDGYGHETQQYDDTITAVDMAIKALEQEDILDKIRAEIIELRNKQNVGVLECLDIIDKYRK